MKDITMTPLRHVPFPAIGEFRKVIKYIHEYCNYHRLVTKPTLRFLGTVKLHGSNASIVLQRGGSIYAQCREHVLNEEQRLNGFYDFVEATRAFWQGLLEGVLAQPEHAKTDTIVLYGEWCGGPINRNIAITDLPQMFVLFKLKSQVAGIVKQDDVEQPGYVSTYHPLAALHQLWLTHISSSEDERVTSTVYSVSQFDQYVITVDFNSPQEMQNRLGDITNAVEKQCPAGRYFGRDGVGEGVVWSVFEPNDLPFRTDNLMFKVKGQKHSDTNVKVLATVDVETITSHREFADMVVTEHRLEKGVEMLRHLTSTSAEVFTHANTGAFVRWVLDDVKKEQSDTIAENGLDLKSVLPIIAQRSKQWFISHIPQDAVA